MESRLAGPCPANGAVSPTSKRPKNENSSHPASLRPESEEKLNFICLEGLGFRVYCASLGFWACKKGGCPSRRKPSEMASSLCFCSDGGGSQNKNYSQAPKAGHIKASRSGVNFGGIGPFRGGPWGASSDAQFCTSKQGVWGSRLRIAWKCLAIPGQKNGPRL